MSLRCYNRVTLLLVLLLAAAALLPILTYAPNRLVSGAALSLPQAFPAYYGGLALPVALLLALAFIPGQAALAVTLITAQLLFISLLAMSGSAASRLAAEGSALARTSAGSGLWLMLALALLLCSDAVGRLTASPLKRWLLQAQVWVIPALLLFFGHFHDLSLLREYANRQDVFNDALARHLTLLFGTLVPALFIGVPLGLAAYRHRRLQPAIFGVLNVIQTVPSVALFGLLIAPLAGLSRALPWLGELGVSGIGMAPALIALVLYALLPLARSVVAGMNSVPENVRESARGMGMSRRQIFWRVEMMLALPVLLRGLKVVAVQTVGMAVVAALIGAGGFGALVFQGLLSSALDLVLLGVIPTIALAVVVDALFNLLIAGLEAKRHD